MRVEVTMPRMGQSMEEGRVLRWLKPLGAAVARGEALLEIETDKATVEIEAFAAGTLAQIVTPEGGVVPTGTVIAFIETGQAEAAPAAPPAPAAARPRANASPVARRLAQEHGVDLAELTGTGPDGRIGKEDVERYLAQRSRAAGPAQPAAPAAPASSRRVPLTRLRQATARRMVESKSAAPHFYITIDIEMGRALDLRDSLKRRGLEVSVNVLLLRAAALALPEFPNLNAAFAGDEIVLHPAVDLAVAVAVDEGLITPVIRSAETLSLAGLAAAARAAIERARTGRLRPDDLDGGTFTVSNLGMFGIRQFEAILNPPQAAILAVGAVRRVPVFDAHDRVVPAQLLTATLSADHRVTDGAEAARFLRSLKDILEDAFRLA